MIAFVGYALLSTLLVGCYRWVALRRHWLDAPNHRSSHTTITPRGAGMIFALLIVGASTLRLHSQGAFLPPLLMGLLVALVGWWDDLRGVSARMRFALYALCALFAVLSISAYPDTKAHGPSTNWQLAIGIGTTIGLVWLINLYNFMDGINGIAACEALFVLFAAGVIAGESPYAAAFMSVHKLSMAAILGFLIWNFPAGKIFMGDAGSAFLGFFIGVLMLWSHSLQGPSPAVWLILLGIFIVDSSYTLLVRVGTGQRWYSAHRQHAYQRLTDRLSKRHTSVVFILMAINIAWLFPMAWLVHNHSVNALYGLGIAYLPLIFACFKLHAGIPTPGGV